MSIVDELKAMGFNATDCDTEDNSNKYVYRKAVKNEYKLNLGEKVFDAPIAVYVKRNKINYACIDVWGEYDIPMHNIKTVAQLKKMIEALKGE